MNTFTIIFTEQELELVESIMTEYTEQYEGHSSLLTEQLVTSIRSKLAMVRAT